MRLAAADNAGMARAKKPQRTIKLAKFSEVSDGDLYIGAWIAFVGKRQVAVAKDAGITEGYLSALISGKHGKDPALSVLKAVARAIGVPVQALFVAPPDKRAVAAEYALRSLRNSED